MNKTIYKYLPVFWLFSIAVSSCTKNFQEINTDPNNSKNAAAQQLLAPALVNTLTFNMVRNRNFNNELMQVSVDIGDGDGKVFRYDFRSTWSDYLYNGWYAQLTNFKDIYKAASQDITYNKSYMGISLICQSWIYSLLTDTYGDVPYFESNKVKEEEGGISEPVIDSQKVIYLDIFKKLEQANTLLVDTVPIYPSGDPVYGGRIASWRRFGNSLYLRLLLRISGKAEVADLCKAKIKEIVELKPSTYPIMSNNDESAILKWTGYPPYISPFMNAVRAQDFRTPGVCSFFIDHLTSWNDPRINPTNYGTSGVNRYRIAPSSGQFVGTASGYSPGEPAIRKSYFYATTDTVNKIAAANLMSEPLTGMMMNFAEVKFILAEAALKGWLSGSANTYYNDGVLNGIKLWLPSWPDTSTKIYNVVDYLDKADMTWIESESFDEKMEKIHLQKYYAMFCTDLQQWFEYRRTGHPVLPKGSGLKNNGIMPARMAYPVYIQSTNPTNYKKAVAAQGPDVISTQVWWQKL